MRSDTWRAASAAVIVGVIAFIDWRVELDAAFGFLYVFPLILVGTIWPLWQIAALAVVCTTLADVFDPYSFVAAVSIPRDVLVFTSLAGTGFFAHALTRSRRLAIEAEEKLAFLVQTSPAAILTIADDGTILLANAAAHELLRAPSGSLRVLGLPRCRACRMAAHTLARRRTSTASITAKENHGHTSNRDFH